MARESITSQVIADYQGTWWMTKQKDPRHALQGNTKWEKNEYEMTCANRKIKGLQLYPSSV